MANLNSQVQQVAGVQHQQADRSFWTTLAHAVPDWQAINDSMGFNDWLQQIDAVSGIRRQVLIDDAHHNLDFDRAVSIFNAYKQVAGLVGGGVSQVTAPNTINPLTDQAVVTPNKRSQAIPTGGASQKIITKADLLKLYDDERKGYYKGRDEEFRKREAEIVTAINENRYAN